jgi:ABC-type transport system involved in multi-copper enzyme maturation permease subunit
MSTAEVVSARPGTLDSLLALYRLLLHTQITVKRLLGIGALGALSIVLGVFSSLDDNPPQAAADHVSAYGLGILVPLAALWLGTSAIGDLVEDKLLVYLSLKPVSRWQLPAAAVLATVSVVLPLTALPLTVSAIVAGAGDVALATLLAASFAALAYAGLFVAAGLWFRRAVWWGLAFILIWENVAAYTAEGAARFTVFGWASSVLGLAHDIHVQFEPGSPAVAFVVLPAIAIAAWLAATWRYRRADID